MAPKGQTFLSNCFAEAFNMLSTTPTSVSRFIPPVKIESHRRTRSPKKKHNTTLSLEFVDYEIFPFRTTKSCCENGKPATSIGSGGMDLLLASNQDGVVVPAMGEIKAATETVGPTFALVQSLMYTAQLVTRNQFLRLKKHYGGPFASIDEKHPRMDFFVLLEVDRKLNQDDLSYALSLADKIKSPLSEYLRQIVFMSCRITGDAVECDPVTDNSDQ